MQFWQMLHSVPWELRSWVVLSWGEVARPLTPCLNQSLSASCEVTLGKMALFSWGSFQRKLLPAGDRILQSQGGTWQVNGNVLYSPLFVSLASLTCISTQCSLLGSGGLLFPREASKERSGTNYRLHHCSGPGVPTILTVSRFCYPNTDSSS